MKEQSYVAFMLAVICLMVNFDVIDYRSVGAISASDGTTTIYPLQVLHDYGVWLACGLILASAMPLLFAEDYKPEHHFYAFDTVDQTIRQPSPNTEAETEAGAFADESLGLRCDNCTAPVYFEEGKTFTICTYCGLQNRLKEA